MIIFFRNALYIYIIENPPTPSNDGALRLWESPLSGSPPRSPPWRPVFVRKSAFYDAQRRTARLTRLTPLTAFGAGGVPKISKNHDFSRFCNTSRVKTLFFAILRGPDPPKNARRPAKRPPLRKRIFQSFGRFAPRRPRKILCFRARGATKTPVWPMELLEKCSQTKRKRDFPK